MRAEREDQADGEHDREEPCRAPRPPRREREGTEAHQDGQANVPVGLRDGAPFEMRGDGAEEMPSEPRDRCGNDEVQRVEAVDLAAPHCLGLAECGDQIRQKYQAREDCGADQFFCHQVDAGP